MKAANTLLLLGLTLGIFQAQASERLYQTNALAVVDMSDVLLKRDKEQLAPSEADLINQMKTKTDILISHAYTFDNSKEIDNFIISIKEKKLEKKMQKDFQNLQRARERAFYESTWQFFSTFARSNGIGLLDENEYQEVRGRLIEVQKRRFARSKKVESANQEMKVITDFDIKYKALRQEQLVKNEKLCLEETDWSHLFSPRKGQTSTGWCYAFAYADYIEATQNQSVSAADLVLQYKPIIQKDELDRYNKFATLYKKEIYTDLDLFPIDYIYTGGDFERIFRKKDSLSVCSENDLRSEAKDKKGQPVDMGYVIEWINEIGSDFKNNRTTQKEIKDKLLAFGYLEIFPHAKIDDVLNQLKSGKSKDLYILLAESTCKDKKVNLENKTSDWVMQGYSTKYSLVNSLEKLTEILNSSPAIVAVNDNFLYKENDWGKDQASNHVILISGKRWNKSTGHCEFKIRNSQTARLNETEKIWYTDTELLRNLNQIYITPFIWKKN